MGEFSGDKVKGIPALFSEVRIDRDSIPDNLFVYEVRHDDEGFLDPAQIKRWIMVNFYGTLITKVPLLGQNEDSIYIEDGEWEESIALSSRGLDGFV